MVGQEPEIPIVADSEFAVLYCDATGLPSSFIHRLFETRANDLISLQARVICILRRSSR